MAGYIGSKAAVVSSGAERKKTFDITTSTTSLTGLSYTVGQVHVFHNGVRLVDGTDYTATNGTSITLTAAAENGDQVVVVSYASFQTSDTVSASAGGTFAGDVTFDGTFTSQGIDDNATSTAMTLDASGDLLVGKTNTLLANAGVAIYSDPYKGLVEVTRDGGQAMILNRKTSDGTIVDLRKDGSPVGSIGNYGTELYLGSTGGTDAFIRMGYDTVAPANSLGNNRDAAINLGASNNRFKDLYLSGGVYLGGTGSANKLDDVEEGTWTPTLSEGTTNSTLKGHYYKVGSVVHFTLRAVYLNERASTGQITFQMPFTASSYNSMGVNCRNIAFIRYTNLDSGYTYVNGAISDGNNQMFLEQLGDYKTNIPLRYDQLDSAYNWIEVSGQYFV